jgi:hypothetical protein
MKTFCFSLGYLPPKYIRFFPFAWGLIAYCIIGGASSIAAPSSTFTTKDGRTYTSSSFQAIDSGLVVLTSDGGATISYDELPDDLSPFPPDIQKAILQHRRQALSSFSAQKTAPLDQRCYDFIEAQVAAWQPVYATQHLPASVKVLVDTAPVIQSIKQRPSSTVEVTPVLQGSTITPTGFLNGCFVVPITATESYDEVVGVSHGVNLSFNAHFEKRSDQITGMGLVPVKNTSFVTDIHDQIQRDLLAQKLSLAHLVLTEPVKIPLSSAGVVAGYETMAPGTGIGVKQCGDDSVVASPDGQTETVTIPKSSTDWADEMAMLANAVKLQGFVDRLNQLIGKEGLNIRYDGKAPKRFTISDDQNESWGFNPEDLSSAPPKIFDQSLTQDTDEYLVYSHMAVIGYADETRAAVAGERTDAAATSHTHTTVSIYFVTVEAKPTATLVTTVPGEVQRHKLIFRILDKADANELADLFSDFCHTFGVQDDVSGNPHLTEPELRLCSKVITAVKPPVTEWSNP